MRAQAKQIPEQIRRHLECNLHKLEHAWTGIYREVAGTPLDRPTTVDQSGTAGPASYREELTNLAAVVFYTTPESDLACSVERGLEELGFSDQEIEMAYTAARRAVREPACRSQMVDRTFQMPAVRCWAPELADELLGLLGSDR